MSRTIEKTLTMLLPTASGGIPKELIDLTGSVLHQSRNYISNLNSSEEPAREMICAHLACDKMKTKLGLPSITRPPAPVPPRIYNVLYRQFSDILFPSKTPVSTPKHPRQAKDAGTPSAANISPSKTPSKRQATKPSSLTQFIPTPKKYKGSSPADTYIPAIEHLCTKLDNTRAIQHIVGGYNYIATSFKFKDLAEHPHTLIGALYLVIRTQQVQEDYQNKTDIQLAREHMQLRKTIFNIFAEELQNVSTDTFEDVVQELASPDMKEVAWFRAIAMDCDGKEDDQVEKEEEHVPSTEGKRPARKRGASLVLTGRDVSDYDNSSAVLKPKSNNAVVSGIGTMMQDKVNYLSEKRRKGYEVWKAKIVEQIQSLEAMQTD